MQPQNSPGQSNPYDFLYQEPPKKSKFPFPTGNSTKQRLLLVVGGGVVLLIVFSVIFSLLFGSGNSNQTELMTVAQKQSELIRIASLGTQKAHSTTAKNLAVTTSLSLTSDQAALIKAMSPKPSAKQLALGKNAKTDQTLTQAEQNNRFDEAFVTEIQKELLDYQKAMKQAYEHASSNALKVALSAQFKNASALANVKE